MAGKPIRLVYKGKTVPVAWDEDGNVTRRGPERSFPGVPARTIEADEFHVFDIDAKKIKEITGGSDPLYAAEYEDENQPAPESKKGAAVEEKSAAVAETDGKRR
jgi:hypothetical protein